jgi:methionyl-tRNA formyltransferase
LDVKLAILTTKTTHHLHFVQEFARRIPDIGIIVEEVASSAPLHQLDMHQEEHETGKWFGAGVPDFSAYGPVTEVADINSNAAASALEAWRPEMAIVFGTRRILPPLINQLSDRLVNLHGGDPEQYRGLDSHLWAIYHHDFSALITTLHRVSPALDTGDIVLKALLPLHRGMKLYELRSVNTEACVKIALAAFAMREMTGDFIAWPQRQAGRYYSTMPAGLKDACILKFERHTEHL